MKFKCNACSHVFEGDSYSTQNCPNCGSTDIQEVKSTLSKKVLVRILIGVAAIIVILLLFKACKGCQGGPQSVNCDLITDCDPIIVNVQEGSKAASNNAFIIRVIDENGEYVDSARVNGGKASISKLHLNVPDVVYTFLIARIDKGKLNAHWNNGNTYFFTIEKAPVIHVAHPTPNMANKTWTIDVTVDSGDVAQFILYSVNPQKDTVVLATQEGATFTGVQPMPNNNVFVQAIGTNGLKSNICSLGRLGIPTPPMSPAEVEAILTAVANGKMKAGDAVQKLRRGQVGGDLENVLNESYTNHQKCQYDSKTRRVS